MAATARLIVTWTEADGTSQTLPIEGEIVIGRDPSAQIVLDDPQVRVATYGSASATPPLFWKISRAATGST